MDKTGPARFEASWKSTAKAKIRASCAELVGDELFGKIFGSTTNQPKKDSYASTSVRAVETFSARRPYDPRYLMEQQIQLRDYQEEARAKAEEWYSFGCFDEMGTGKTVIGVAIDVMRRQQMGDTHGKTLVVTKNGKPVSHWRRHFSMMAPSLKVVCLDPKARGNSWREFVSTDADVLILHWQAVQLMQKDYLSEIMWLHIIADEVHFIKNRKAKTTKALKKLRAFFKTGLTGTPVDDKPQDYWSILHWFYPKVWTSYHGFVKDYTSRQEADNPDNPNDKRNQFYIPGEPKNVAELHAAVEPYTIRRRTQEAMPWLKDKNYIEYWVEMSPKQAEAYYMMKEDMVAWVQEQREEARGVLAPLVANAVISRLIRLQQFACAYAYVDDENQVHLQNPSSKLDMAEELVEELLEQNEPVVVFSFFKPLVYMLEARLRDKKIDCVTYTGDTSGPDRDAAVDRFQAGDVDVFIGTLGAGGESIELFRSKWLIFLSRDWKVTKNQQAEGRLWRSGQEGIVNVVDIMVEDTVEIDKKERIELKWEWIQQMIGD